MKTDEQGQYIELGAFLKIKGLATTGGQAKVLIRSGDIKVNGEVETRIKRKLRQGFVVECKSEKFTINLSDFG